MGRLETLDAVTLDVYGTLVRLNDAVPRLVEALRVHGIEAAPENTATAFSAEVAYYGPRSHEGRDESSLADLRERCAGVFLESLGADLASAEFAPSFFGALEFEVLPGTFEALRALRSHGIDLAVVTNWDISIHDHLERLAIAPFLSHVVTSAETGARKPDPAVFRRALELLAVLPERALHVGDDEADREGARSAGMGFAEAPLARAVGKLI